MTKQIPGSRRLIESFSSKNFRLCLEPENTSERKKNVKKNDFLMFGSMVENMKENKSKFLKILHIFKFISP